MAVETRGGEVVMVVSGEIWGGLRGGVNWADQGMKSAVLGAGGRLLKGYVQCQTLISGSIGL